MSLQKNIKLLTWFNFFTDFSLYGPIAIIYFSQVSHSYALGASVFSILFITAAIFDVPTGIYSDRIGRKNSIILGAAFSVIAAIFYAIGLHFWILAIGSVFQGLARAFYSGNNNALLYHMLAEEGLEGEYHTYSGKLSSMFQLALTLSGILSGLVAYRSFPLAVWLSVIPQIACLVISLFLIDTKRINHESRSMREHLGEAFHAFIHNNNLRLLSISSILSYGLGEAAYQFQAAFFNTVLPLWAVGFARMLTNLFGTVSFYFSGKIINKFSSIKVLLMDDIAGSIINFLALLFPTFLSPFLMASTSLMYGVVTTAQTTLLQKEFTDRERATMSSLNSFGGSLFFGIVAFLLGFVADKIGPAKALLIIVTFSLSIIWFHWKLYQLAQNKGASHTSSA